MRIGKDRLKSLLLLLAVDIGGVAYDDLYRDEFDVGYVDELGNNYWEGN